jgi:pantoate--beta-alanine ligase
MLRGEHVDLLFAPDVVAVYPFGLDRATRVAVPILSGEFCAASRPGHFDGVTSVVMRLFALLQPDVAVFGQKDYQQQLLIRHMVDDIGLAVRIELGPVIREPGGLAMSSRNNYLSNEERAIATELFLTLQRTAAELLAGNSDFGALEDEAKRALVEAKQSPESVAIRRASDLSVPQSNCRSLIFLAATRVGSVRLIDNIIVEMP